MLFGKSKPFDATLGALAGEDRPGALGWTFPRSLPKLLLAIVGAAASCAVLVSLSVMFIDRPVASWVHAHLGDSRFAFFTMPYDTHPLAIGPFSLMAGPAEALHRLALFVIVMIAAAAVAGWRPTGRRRTILVVSLTILVAVALNGEAKSAFGRTWPESWLGNNPSWVRDGVFEFAPFHGGPGFGSFPSGHTTLMTTLATLLWFVWPELRVLWVAMVAIVITGLIGANYHFISDVIGGVYLGVAVGLGGAQLALSPRDRVSAALLAAAGAASRSPAAPST
jgi:membrane-associated phospholipid phosphatase